MIKMISFLRRRPDLSRVEFRDRYENEHVPLIARLLPYWTDYRRNYVLDTRHETAHLPNRRPLDDSFDVVTELTFADESAYRSMLALLSDEHIAAEIVADEERLFDRRATRTVLVDEYVSANPVSERE